MCKKRALQPMIDTIRSIVAGEHSRRIRITGDAELVQLAAEVNKLAESYQMARETIRALNQQLRGANRDAIMALIQALSAKDPYTREHAERVSLYSLMLSERLDLPGEEIDGIHIASYLHDVGKIGIPEQILNKAGQLTLAEYEQIKTHADLSSQIVSQIPNLSHIAHMVRYHHERYDGLGYPEGLKGDEIPLGSRVLAIADAFDAMTSRRPYRTTYDPHDALAEIKRGGGTQFDPHLSELFVDTYARSYDVSTPDSAAC